MSNTYEKMNFGYNNCNVNWGPLQTDVSEADMVKLANKVNAKGFTYHPTLKYGKVMIGDYPKGCESPANESWSLYLLKTGPSTTTLTVENLLELADREVKSNVTTCYTAMLQNAGHGDRNVIYPNPPSAISPKNASFVNDVACAFICSAISYSSLYNFANCVSRNRADSFWQRSLTQTNANCMAEGSHLYTHYFPDYCRKDGKTFRMYQEDGGSKWAKRLHDVVVHKCQNGLNF